MNQQPAQKHTLDSLTSALLTHKPELQEDINTTVDLFREPSITDQQIASELTRLLGRDVTPTGSTTRERTFSWLTPKDQVVLLTIDKPESSPAETPPAETETPETLPELTHTAPAEAETPSETPEAPAEPNPEEPEAPADETAEERTPLNLLEKLDTLLDDTNLHLIIQRTGKRDGQNILSLTIIPNAKDDKADASLFTPMNLSGTAHELEDGLLEAIKITADGNQSIQAALADLEAAKKEAAEAAKAEAAAKRKAAAGKKAAPEKKEEPAAPETPGLFDPPPESTAATQ